MAIVSSAQLKKEKFKKNNQQELLLKKDVYEHDYLSKAEDYKAEFNQDLTKLSLEQLADQFIEIDRQSHILKGRILLEARSRFPSDKEFGKWVSTHSLCVGSQQSRNRLMHLAEFFGDERDLDGIAITVAYEISAPVNREKALTVYENIKGKNISVKEVKVLLTDNGKNNASKNNPNNNSEEVTFSEQEVDKFVINFIDSFMIDKSDELKVAVLQKAIKFLKNKIDRALAISQNKL